MAGIVANSRIAPSMHPLSRRHIGLIVANSPIASSMHPLCRRHIGLIVANSLVIPIAFRVANSLELRHSIAIVVNSLHEEIGSHDCEILIENDPQSR